MKNIVLLSVMLTVAQGCSSIDQPKASRALVEHQYVAQAPTVDSSLSIALSNSKAGSVLSIEQQATLMGLKFFSATGLTCRKLTSEFAGQHIYCLNPKSSWFKVNKVISEYNDSDMSKAIL